MLTNTRGGVGGERGGPSVIATLKVRVARLEAALRDKELELSRLQASSKVTTTNELRIQAQTYYQEVVRLRNQLNISQHTISPIIQRSTVTANQVNGSVQPSDSSREEATSTRVPLGAASQAATSPSEPRNIFYKRKQLTNNKLSNMESTKEEDSDEASKSTDAVKLQKEDEMLRASLGTLHDENEKLREHVTTLVNTIRNSDEAMSTSSREVLERLLHKLEERDEPGSSKEPPALHEHDGEALKSRETEWQRERNSLKELIDTLQEDRTYYLHTVSKKEEEMLELRSEMLSLQQQMLALQQKTKTYRGITRTRPPPLGSVSASSTESNSQSRSSRSSIKPGMMGSSSRSSATTLSGGSSAKASSEPRELPPRTAPRPSKVMSTSVTSGGTNNMKQQQLATSTRLATNKAPATPRTTSIPPKRQTAASTAGRSAAATSATSASRRVASVSRTSASSRSSQPGTPSRTTQPVSKKTVPVSSSSRSSGSTSVRNSASSSSRYATGGSKSSASSAASSRSSSQKPTPLASPVKSQNSSSRSSKNIPLTSAMRPRSATSKSSSSSTQSSRQSSVPNSTPSTPSRSNVTSPVKTKSSQASMKPNVANAECSANFTAISEEDANVLVELLRPQPGESEESSSGSVVTPAADAASLHWDTAGGGADTDDTWGMTYKGPPSLRNSASSSPLHHNSVSSHESDIPVQDKPARSPQRRAMVENVMELRTMLSSHMQRQLKLDELLKQEPRLMPPSANVRSVKKGSRGRKSLHRRSPDGAEGQTDVREQSTVSKVTSPVTNSPAKAMSSMMPVASPRKTKPKVVATPAARAPEMHRSSEKSRTPEVPRSLTKLISPSKKSKTQSGRSSESDTSVQSPGLVRQGTFNLDQSEAFIDKSQMGEAGENCELGEQGWLVDDKEEDCLSETIAGHIARVRLIQHLKE